MLIHKKLGEKRLKFVEDRLFVEGEVFTVTDGKYLKAGNICGIQRLTEMVDVDFF